MAPEADSKSWRLTSSEAQYRDAARWCEVAQTDDVDVEEGWNPAWFTPPWESFDQGHEAEQRLEHFMLQILIPLVVETNAVIICDAASRTSSVKICASKL